MCNFFFDKMCFKIIHQLVSCHQFFLIHDDLETHFTEVRLLNDVINQKIVNIIFKPSINVITWQ